MSQIKTGTGLISGIDIAGLVDALSNSQRAATARLEVRAQNFKTTETGIKTLEANLLSIKTQITRLADKNSFGALKITNSDLTQVRIQTREGAQPGSYQFQAVRRATTHRVTSRGFVNADQQAVGSGTLTIASGGVVNDATLLDSLNGGNGIRRGTLQITDRSGKSAEIDLSNVYIVDDVLTAINSSNAVSVTASTSDGRLVITDTSGGSTGNLTISEVNGGHVAEDLGIGKSVDSSTLNGDDVFYITGDFTFDQINDGNGIQRTKTAPDIRISLSDDSVLEVNLDSAATLNGVIDAINNHEENGGRVSAALVDGHLQLNDLSGGGGTTSFKVEDINNASVTRQLGLNVDSADNKIDGRRLAAGLNSVLVRNLNGGSGIDQLGQLSLTDRTGTNATIDLSGADSLDQIINAINTAESSSGTKLKLTAQINSNGTGIEIRDTSGATASKLVITDVGGSTIASQLGLSVNSAVTTVNSGSLKLRHVNEATSIDTYAPDGGAVAQGAFRIIDSAGEEAIINITSSVKTVGDALVRINAASNISVRAELNKTGDGFVLVDTAGGGEPLRVEEIDGTTAADLRITGEAALDSSGDYRIDSRRTTIVNISATDTLDDLVSKINENGAFVTASVFNDGSAFNSSRLALTSKISGSQGRVVIDAGNLDLGLTTVNKAQDALLRRGGDVENGFLTASSSNTFTDIAEGVDVEVLTPGTATADVQINRDTSAIAGIVKTFVNTYNSFVDTSGTLTRYNSESNTRGILQGKGIVLRLSSRLEGVINSQFFDSQESVRSLVGVGVRIGEGGKLVFNQERFESMLREDFDGTSKFFLDTTDGFSAKMKGALESLTDPINGTISLEVNAIQSSGQALNNRIEQLDILLASQKDRLLRQFANMEAVLGSLTAQQQALGSISSLKINPAPGK